jgi:hypothetical protein
MATVKVIDNKSHWENWIETHLEFACSLSLEKYTSIEDQLTKGDYKALDGGFETNIEVKRFDSLWDGLLVELIQHSTPTSDGIRSPGWFYNLTRCDEMYCGYYSGDVLSYVYKVNIKKLRLSWDLIHRQNCARNSQAIGFCNTGWGTTIFSKIPWDMLLEAKIVSLVFERQAA